MSRPQPEEYAEYYKKYVDTVLGDVLTELERQMNTFSDLIGSISEEKGNFAYGPDKWTVKELIGHVIDTERIMVYRLLRIARNDSTPLSGFEENEYVRNSSYPKRTMTDLASEFEALRKANMFLFRSVSESEKLLIGTASGFQVSVRALLYIIAGHVNHHERILNERYL